MSSQNIITQTSKQPFWTDETGSSIPYGRITPSERIKEKQSAQILKKAQNVNSMLLDLKETMDAASIAVFNELSKEHKVKIDGKGNLTWFNFNKSIKIETNVNESIKFDEALIESAKEILMGIIDKNLTGDDFVKGLVSEAFKTSKGKLDTKRILSLKKHTSRIRHKEIKESWSKAMELIDSSISRPDSKRYMRVYVKGEDGSYQNINLNFSSI